MTNYFSQWQVARLYKTDQKGIMFRFLRETKQWKNHLDRTKQFILKSVENNFYNSIAVLGSGWLLDLPVNELLEKTTTLYLIDIVHPNQVRHKFRKNEKIVFVNQDITHGLVELATHSKSIVQFIRAMDLLVQKVNYEQFDLVISLNLLNQLDTILLEYLTRKFKISESYQLHIRKTIQDMHVSNLPKGKSCLISDWIEKPTDINNSLMQNRTEKQLIYTDLLNNYAFESWNWEFDTHKTYRKKNNTRFIVKGFNI